MNVLYEGYGDLGELAISQHLNTRIREVTPELEEDPTDFYKVGEEVCGVLDAANLEPTIGPFLAFTLLGLRGLQTFGVSVEGIEALVAAELDDALMPNVTL